MFAYGKYVREWLVWVDCGAGATYLSKLPFAYSYSFQPVDFIRKAAGKSESEFVQNAFNEILIRNYKWIELPLIVLQSYLQHPH